MLRLTRTSSAGDTKAAAGASETKQSSVSGESDSFVMFVFGFRGMPRLQCVPLKRCLTACWLPSIVLDCLLAGSRILLCAACVVFAAVSLAGDPELAGACF